MKIGFIGLGNMARAMIGGMLQKEMVKPEEIIGSAKTRETREKMAAEYIGVKHAVALSSECRCGGTGRYAGACGQTAVF